MQTETMQNLFLEISCNLKTPNNTWRRTIRRWEKRKRKKKKKKKKKKKEDAETYFLTLSVRELHRIALRISFQVREHRVMTHCCPDVHHSPMTWKLAAVETREIQKVSLRFTLTGTRIENRRRGGGEKAAKRESEKKFEEGRKTSHFRTSRLFVFFSFTKRRTTREIVPLSKRYQFLSDKIRITPRNRTSIGHRFVASARKSLAVNLNSISATVVVSLKTRLPIARGSVIIRTTNRTFPLLPKRNPSRRGVVWNTAGKITRHCESG